MEIHLVTGKGGVGKTLSSVALALDNPQKTPTLLVDVGGLDQTLGRTLRAGNLPSTSTPWRGEIHLAHWSGESCLREYALHLLRSETLYRLFFENRVSRTLIQVAPGLAELALTGKITSGPPRNVGPRLPFQRLVIDCPSSGHFMALLRAPLGMSQTFRFGPMADQSKSILEVLRNPKLVHVHIVTTPDTLPLEEAEELANEVDSVLAQKSHFILNKWMPISPAVTNEPTTDRQLFLSDRFQKQRRTLEICKNSRNTRSVTIQDFVIDPASIEQPMFQFVRRRSC